MRSYNTTLFNASHLMFKLTFDWMKISLFRWRVFTTQLKRNRDKIAITLSSEFIQNLEFECQSCMDCEIEFLKNNFRKEKASVLLKLLEHRPDRVKFLIYSLQRTKMNTMHIEDVLETAGFPEDGW